MHVYPTPKELANWITKAHKGDRFTYHTGHLVHDRAFRANLAHSGGFMVVRVKPLDEIADAAVAAYEAGFVVLAQKHLGEDLFQYLAIRTKKYQPAPLEEKSK
jgi:hypothetical protein